MHHSLWPGTPSDPAAVDPNPNSVGGTNSTSIIQSAHAAGKKVIIVVGGANAGPAFVVATDPSHLSTFTQNIKNFIDSFSPTYDGVDIDWEENLAANTAQYSNLITDLRTKMDTYAPHKLLTAAIVWTDNATLLGTYGQLQSKFDQ